MVRSWMHRLAERLLRGSSPREVGASRYLPHHHRSGRKAAEHILDAENRPLALGDPVLTPLGGGWIERFFNDPEQGQLVAGVVLKTPVPGGPYLVEGLRIWVAPAQITLIVN